MKLSKFSFELPEDLHSQHPCENRDEARLMVLDRKKQTIEHRTFKDILEYFDDGDVMMLNDTKVFPARIYGEKEKTGAIIEVFLLRELDKENRLWDVLVDPARKIRIGNKLYFGKNDELSAEVIDNTTSRGRTLKFLDNDESDNSYNEFREKLEKLGETPLPDYITRDTLPEDEERFQTIFAKKEGAIAPPAAGMHFSKHLLKRLEIKGVEFADMTLHIGLGSFSPVEVEDLSKHKMFSERAIISAETSDIVNRAKKRKKRVCAVDNSVMRASESSVSSNGALKPFEGWTNKFIFPPYDFKVANCMITNFHPPKSTLMMMAGAFAGMDLLTEAYKQAVEQKYKFFAYGDAMLII